MLVQSLRALFLTPGGPGSIWIYIEPQLRSTGVSGSIVYGFLTDSHFAAAHMTMLEKVAFHSQRESNIMDSSKQNRGVLRNGI